MYQNNQTSTAKIPCSWQLATLLATVTSNETPLNPAELPNAKTILDFKIILKVII